MAKKTVTITDENQWTLPLLIGREGAILMIGDNTDFVGTLTVQFGTEDFTSWIDDMVYTDTVVDHIRVGTEMYVRVGTKIGDYTSGSIKAVVYRGWIAS